MKNRLVHERATQAAVRHDKKRPGVKQVLSVLALALFFLPGLTKARAQEHPSAGEILAQVRLQQSQQQLDLHGQLRTDATVTPFRITQTGPTIRYTFANSPEVLQLKLGEKDSQLSLLTNTTTKRFASSHLDDRIGASAITYGDLALQFLYWPDPQFIGSDSVRTRACWKLRLHPPSHEAQYSTVILWVDQASGAFLRLEGYDWQNRLVKKFEVVSAQKIEGRWFLKQMRIEALDPATQKVAERTYLEISK